MKTKEAVAERIIQICRERNMAINVLTNISGVSPSTIYSMLNEKGKNPALFQSRICATVWRSASVSSLIRRCLTGWSKR